MSSQRICLALLLLSMMYGYPKSDVKRVVQQKPVCNSKWCDATNMWVDTWRRTQLMDQSGGAGMSIPKQLPTRMSVYNRIESDYARDQMTSPGVRLVAHAVA